MEFVQDLLTTFNFIVQGLWVTISVTAVALITGVVIGIVLAIVRVYGHPSLQVAVTVYSVVIRAVPVIVIIFILFFVISRYVNLSPFWAGALALGFASGAYQTEIFRGALQAVQPGQMIAARAIGMSRLQAIQSVVLPQALRLALPAWGNEANAGAQRFDAGVCGGCAGNSAPCANRSARAPSSHSSPLALRCCSTWR
jgi:polar amino acid transport system permease protein